MLDSIKKENYYYDVVVIGGGGAGLMSASELASAGLNVAIISKIPIMQSHTIAAQGGINAVFGNSIKDDWRWLMYDTVKGSDWLGDQDAIETLCLGANDAVQTLADLGVNFDKDDFGNILQKPYGGQTLNFGKSEGARRACSVADKTGIDIMRTLYRRVKALDIKIYEYNFAVEILFDNNDDPSAIFAFDIKNNKINVFYFKNLIIATGGYSQIYSTTTSSDSCTGDGIGLAVRSGLDLQDMEFIQFHPTGLNKIGVLVSETARAIGGELKNKYNEKFMHKYAPVFKELASRDIVSRAIATEIKIGNGFGRDDPYVHLDLRNLPRELIAEKLPQVTELCKTFAGINIFEQPIPVSPAAHYTMGGIPTNKFAQVERFINNKSIIVKGLYAIGEVACHSVHGANRLGCNSLLDLIVFAKVAAKKIINSDNKVIKSSEIKINYKFKTIFDNNVVYENYELIKQRLKSILQKNVGVFRDKDSLNSALNDICLLEKKLSFDPNILANSFTWNKDLTNYLELENLLICSKATVASALNRNESRGAHWRDDFKERDDDNFLYHTIINLSAKNYFISHKPVRFNNEMGYFCPIEKRNY